MNPAAGKQGVARCGPTSDDLDDEIRGHLAISVKERIERGEDPDAARLAALKEFGNVTLTRDSMRGVWRPRWFDAAEALGTRHPLRPARAAARQGPGRHRRRHARARHRRQRRDLQRRPRRAAPSARQSRRRSPDLHPPERAGARRREHRRSRCPKSTTSESRVTRDQRVRRVLHGGFHDDRSRRRAAHGESGRRQRLVLRRDGPAPRARPPVERAATTARTRRARRCSRTGSGPPRSTAIRRVIGKTIRLGPRTATVVGVLEPSVPYPADTEIIANVVTSPHHLGATMVTSRTHRMTELFGRLAPGRLDRGGARRADRGARGDDARAPRGVSRRRPTSS